jgi:hypothetical protein
LLRYTQLLPEKYLTRVKILTNPNKRKNKNLTYRNLEINRNHKYAASWDIEHQRGRLILGPDSEGDMYSGNALTAQLDWTYSSGVINRQIDYQFIILDSGQGKLIESLDKNIPIYIDFRTYVFRGNTSQSIYVYLPTLGCLRILDQDLNPPETVLWNFNIFQPTQETINILASTALTNLNLILNEKISQNHPPLQILGNEISHTWCYFFEKAELARQFGEYEKVISLLDEATSKGYTPLVDTEWYPFIDAFARSGDWKNAELITGKLIAKNDPMISLTRLQ